MSENSIKSVRIYLQNYNKHDYSESTFYDLKHGEDDTGIVELRKLISSKK